MSEENKLRHDFADGVGALVFSPLSELESIGRNIPYIVSLACFVLSSVATAVCDQFTGLVILRFAHRVFGYPALATGAASMQDMVSWSTNRWTTWLTTVTAWC
jgi:DHA1 family multidrug resistance protein-like MFS transporter